MLLEDEEDNISVLWPVATMPPLQFPYHLRNSKLRFNDRQAISLQWQNIFNNRWRYRVVVVHIQHASISPTNTLYKAHSCHSIFVILNTNTNANANVWSSTKNDNYRKRLKDANSLSVCVYVYVYKLAEVVEQKPSWVPNGSL